MKSTSSGSDVGRRETGTEGDYGITPHGYRLPGETHLGRVALQVSDLDRSASFYRDVLGLRVLAMKDGSAVLGAQGSERPLVELRERNGAAPVPRGGRLGLYHFAILLPNRGALGRFVAHLSGLGVRAGASDHLVSEAIYLPDPDGLGIEVYADRPRSEWHHADRQLAMATEPLDAEDLLRAAGGEAWTGAPTGTTIGHVHLHVGEIEIAEKFYHEGIGLDKVVWSYPGALFLSAGGYHHHLGVNTWAAGAASAGSGDARLLEWEMILPDPEDPEKVATSLSAAGFTPERLDGAITVRDPWGTSLRIRQGG